MDSTTTSTYTALTLLACLTRLYLYSWLSGGFVGIGAIVSTSISSDLLSQARFDTNTNLEGRVAAIVAQDSLLPIGIEGSSSHETSN